MSDALSGTHGVKIICQDVPVRMGHLLLTPRNTFVVGGGCDFKVRYLPTTSIFERFVLMNGAMPGHCTGSSCSRPAESTVASQLVVINAGINIGLVPKELPQPVHQVSSVPYRAAALLIRIGVLICTVLTVWMLHYSRSCVFKSEHFAR